MNWPRATTASLCLIAVCFCSFGCSDGGKTTAVKISPILDVTPSAQRVNDGFLTSARTQIQEHLTRWLDGQSQQSNCFQTLSVQVEPKVLYGQQQDDGQIKNLYHWSALLRLNHRTTGLTAEVEFTSLPELTDKSEPSGVLNESRILNRFVEDLEDALTMLVGDSDEVIRRFKSGHVASQKVLLERISLCEEDELDLLVDEGLMATVDLDVRFRLVALIGERKRHQAASRLIDLIDLNHIEWTRTVIRTLSTLDHPRTKEVLGILSYHESPSLQKEVQSALERLETR